MRVLVTHPRSRQLTEYMLVVTTSVATVLLILLLHPSHRLILISHCLSSFPCSYSVATVAY
jgi:hypothetical protein